MRWRRLFLFALALTGGAAVDPCLLGAQTMRRGATTANVLAAPRRPAAIDLLPLWKRTETPARPGINYPFEVRFAHDGLYVFDYGGPAIVKLSTRTGAVVATMGRRGRGPGELTGQVGLFFGSRRALRFVEHGTGRVLAVERDTLMSVSVAGGRWTTACSWGEDQMVFRFFSASPYDLRVATIGPNARVIDSLQPPWPGMLTEHMIVRQSFLQQVDDAHCAIVPNYFSDLALMARDSTVRVGRLVEPLPPAKASITKRGAAEEARVARGARRGTLDVRRWGERLVVLFQGTTELRGRLLDLYSWDSLVYEGTVVLPHRTLRIDLRGDTLVAVGDDDGEPVVEAMRLRPRRPSRPAAAGTR